MSQITVAQVRADAELLTRPALSSSASRAVADKLKPVPRQLASKDPILFHQIRDRLALLTIQPAGQDG